MDLSKVKSVRVVHSPYAWDDDLPWEYARHAFVAWVDEVLLAGYKTGGRLPSFNEAVSVAEDNGYQLQFVPSPKKRKARR